MWIVLSQDLTYISEFETEEEAETEAIEVSLLEEGCWLIHDNLGWLYKEGQIIRAVSYVIR